MRRLTLAIPALVVGATLFEAGQRSERRAQDRRITKLGQAEIAAARATIAWVEAPASNMLSACVRQSLLDVADRTIRAHEAIIRSASRTSRRSRSAGKPAP